VNCSTNILHLKNVETLKNVTLFHLNRFSHLRIAFVNTGPGVNSLGYWDMIFKNSSSFLIATTWLSFVRDNGTWWAPSTYGWVIVYNQSPGLQFISYYPWNIWV